MRFVTIGVIRRSVFRAVVNIAVTIFLAAQKPIPEGC